MKSLTQLAMASLIALGVSSIPALAYHGGDAVNFAVIRHDLNTPEQIKLVSFEGALSCDLGTENNGQGCALKLRETKTGKTYNLIEASSAMRLFQDGSRNVVIEGRLAGSETIEVRNARTL